MGLNLQTVLSFQVCAPVAACAGGHPEGWVHEDTGNQ